MTAPGEGPPLRGLRILAVEQFGAGPFGSLYLADLGAEVIKVEDPGMGGDVGRYVPPQQEGTSSLYFEAFNRGKRSIELDLKTEAGREVLRRLAQTADAVYSNLRGDQAEALHLTHQHLGEWNPKIVCVALSGYGRAGPEAHLPAYDALIQAQAGWAAITGEPGGPPTKSGLSLVDFIAGLTAALGLLAGVHDAQRTGRGRDVDVDLYRSSLAMLSYQATWYLSAGVTTERQPMSGHASLVPFQFFETADGHLAVGCGKERFFDALVARMDAAEVATDPRYASFSARRESRVELLAVLEREFRLRSTAEWMDLLRGAVPVAPVRSMEAALDRDELLQRDMLATYDSEVLGQVSALGGPVKVSGYTPQYRAAPALGQDREDLLAELGYDAAGVEKLASLGAFGATAQQAAR